MVFGHKITTNNLSRLFNNVKSHLHRGYHTTKHILNHVDHGVRVAKELYSTFEPIIKEVAGHHHHQAIHNNVMKAVSGYDTIKSKVLDAGHHVDQISHASNKLLGKRGLL